VVSGLNASKSPTNGMAVFVWACAGGEKLNAAVPISPMNSRRFMPAPKDHFAAV
jgi:hypothetical protein